MNEDRRRSEFFYEGVLNASGVLVIRMDQAGRCTVIADPNHQFAHSAPQLASAPEDETTDLADWRPVLSLAREVLQTGDPAHSIILTTDEGANTHTFLCNLVPLRDRAGELHEVQITCFDVTELRRTEKLALQERLADQTGRLASGIAHHFNNLLTIVLGYTELALGALPDDGSAHLYLHEVKGAGIRAASLTSQLLSFARRRRIQLKVIDLADVTAGAFELLRNLVDPGIHLSWKASPDLWPVSADPAQIRQLLVNLVTNARDAMPNGGKLTIDLSNVTIGPEADTEPRVLPGHYVVVAVTDDGIGMTDDIKAHLFEPFFTTGNMRTGLGLAVCHGIARQSGGHFSVSSKLGVGTTVKFFLPRVSQQQTPAVATHSVTSLQGQESVLLVEADPSLRALVAYSLRRLGYTVLEASDGLRALDLFSQIGCHIDLMLADVDIPFVGGKDLARRARTMRPSIRVLLMSGHGQDVASSAKAPGDDAPVLPKPFTQASLAEEVRATLDS